ncbi:MAG: hypothetical protein HY710_09110 [Candidatus Latescibacteria bacterium]|nr:hypothetical protein [Candidatus Latescibacterota bacterium]
MSTSQKMDAPQHRKPRADVANPSQPVAQPDGSPASQQPPGTKDDAKDDVYSAEEEEAVMQRLRDLGYV